MINDLARAIWRWTEKKQSSWTLPLALLCGPGPVLALDRGVLLVCVISYLLLLRLCFFFPSGLADVALRLGPYMSISCRKDVCTRTQLVHTSRQIKVEQPKNTQDHQTTTTRKSPSQTCVSSEKTANQTENQTRHTKGAGARTKHPQDRSAKGHSGLTTASLSKTCEKMN